MSRLPTSRTIATIDRSPEALKWCVCVPRPRDHQQCLSASIRLDPNPSFRRDGQDAFGNSGTHLEYDCPHNRLSVCADIDVDVSVPATADGAASAPWEIVVEALKYSGHAKPAADIEASRFRMQSSFVVLKQAFADYAADCFTPQAPALSGVIVGGGGHDYCVRVSVQPLDAGSI